MRNKKLIVIFSVLCAVTVLILVNSVIFSVQHISASCYNDDDAALDEQVTAVSGLKKGKSIFFIDEKNIISEVEKGVTGNNVRVVNVERKFPNAVYINYVRVFEYLRLESGGKAYYLSNSAKVMRITEASEPNAETLITLKIRGNILNETAGGILVSSDANDAALLTAVMSALERVMYRGEAIGILDSIELSGRAPSSKGFIYLHTRTGVYWELQNTRNAVQKLKCAYEMYKSGDARISQVSGTIIASGDKTASAAYSPRNRYADGVSD